MATLHVNKVALTLTLQLPEHVFARYLPSSPRVVGEALAEQVQAYAETHRLGYYPALDYFRQNGIEFDADLLDAADHIGWFVCNAVRDEVQRKLRPVFASLSIQSIQSQAFTMPTVRPHQANALQALATHYTPDTVKTVVIVSSVQKSEMMETQARWASHLAHRWLKESFARIEVSSAQPVG